MRGRKKTILYVTDGISPWVIGGMQAVSRRHIGWLHESGFKVIVVASRADMPTEVDFAHELIELPWPARHKAWKLNPFNYVGQLKQFSRGVVDVIRRVQPDLIYSEGPLLYNYLAHLPLHAPPVIFHPHGLEMFQTTGSLLLDIRIRPMRRLVKYHAQQSARTITQGGSLTDILLSKLGLNQGQVAYLPNCIPTGFRFAERSRMHRSGRFLFVGRHEVRKGLPQLLDAMKNVRGASLDVVGDFGHGIAPQVGVTFHGPIRDREILRTFFDKADFLILPSFAEGMPTVLLEAFGAAIPVIATDVGAVAALVRNNVNGFLIPPADKTALVGALNDAAQLDIDRYRQMSASALELAKTEFAPESVKAMFLKLIRVELKRALSNDARRKAQ